MWLNFPTNPQRTLKEPIGHIVIKFVKELKGFFHKIPSGYIVDTVRATLGLLSFLKILHVI